MGFVNDNQHNCIFNVQQQQQQQQQSQIPLNTQSFPYSTSIITQNAQHSYAPPANLKVQVHPIEIINCGDDNIDNSAAILTLTLAAQPLVFIKDDDSNNKVVPLIQSYFSENSALDDLRISNLNFKIGNNTYVQHDFCPPYTISTNGKPIKIRLTKKNDPSQSNSDITLILWGCSKSSKTNNLKTLSVNGLILDNSKKHIVDTHDDNIWNETQHLIQSTSSKENLVSSKSSQNQSEEAGW